MKNEFIALVNEAIENKVFPGCNIGIVKINENGDCVKSFYSFGNKALFPEIIKNDIDTIYDLASCSKVISTTTCIMLLLQRGKIRLYDYVKKYIPEYIHDDVTIWDLLTHTSGLPEGLAGCHQMQRDEIIKGILSLELKEKKNTKIMYSDCGFAILGMLVEKVSGKTLDQFAKENLFDVLDMKDTCYNPSDASRCAPTEDRGGYIDLGYVHDEMCHNLGGVAGHAGVFSTVKDISNFIEMILLDGKYNGKKFFDKSVIDLLYKAQVEEKVGNGIETNKRGLGWIVKCKNSCSGDLVSDETIMHTGFTGTNVFIDRVNKIGFVMLSNRVHPTRNNPRLVPFRSQIANFVIANKEYL